MAADQGLIDSVSNANTKVYGDTMATIQGLALQNAVANNNIQNQNATAHQAAMQQFSIAVLSKAVGKLLDPVEEAVAVEKEAAAGLPESILTLLSALGGGQQAVKAAQSTPPETAIPSK